MKYHFVRATLLGLVTLLQSAGQVGILTTAAGNGSSIYSGDNIPASQASVGGPTNVALDRAGNLYIADSGNSRILKVNALTGILTSIAGGGSGGDGGLATNALLVWPCGVRLDAADNIYISESCVTASGGAGGGGFFSLSRIRRIDALTGIITTVAGTGTSGFSGDNGLAVNAMLNVPAGLGIDSLGNLCVADSANNRIRYITTTSGNIYTIAGTGIGQFLGDGVPSNLSPINTPFGCTFDGQGNLYIADTSNSRIRKVDALTGIISTVAGTSVGGFNGDGIPATSAQISFPFDVTVDAAGNIYFVDGGNLRIRRIDAATGLISTVAGGGSQPANDGVSATAVFLNQPVGLVLGSGNRLYFSDLRGSKVWTMVLPSVSPVSVTLSASKSVVDSTSDPVTLTATVTPASATGTVTFFAGGSNIGDVSLVNGVASRTLNIPYVGAFQFQARYSGDSNNGPSSSNFVTVALKGPSSVSLYTDVTAATTSQLVTINAAITPYTVTGTIQFFNGTTLLATVPLSGAFPTFTTQLPAGSNTITASYSGDNANYASTSPPVIVNVKNASTVAVVSSSNPATTGQTVSFTATVSPAGATGTVQFSNGAVILGTATLNNGVATLAASQLAAGTYSITATYSGDNLNTSATSSTLSQVVKGNSSVVIVSGANPALPGQAVTFTATVTPASATGTIEFRNGATVLGTSTLSGGVAAFTTSQLAAGNNNITANYGGDSLNLGAVSSPLVQLIQANSTTAIQSSANPANVGQLVTLTATVSPTTATGSVQFLVGGTVIGSAALANGIASFATTQLVAGTNQITASYSGDSATAASTSTALSQIVKASSTVLLSSSANPAGVGQAITFTARVSPATATGAIQFLNGTSVLGSAPISNGAATITTSQLTRGVSSITASYGGDSLTLASTSAILSQEVKSTSSLTLTSSLNPATAGQTITFTARINPTNATGMVEFLSGTGVIGTAAISNGAAAFSTKDLAAGTYSIVARYGGDTTLLGATSSALNQTIRARGVVTLTSSLNPAAVGQTVTFTATVTPASATGSIVFLRGTTELGSAVLSNGVVTFGTNQLPAGISMISASYGGDATTTADRSNTIRQVVRTNSSVSLVTSANPTTAGEPVSFTAAVSPATATGSVQFLNGTVSLGYGAINNGVARLTTSRLVAGTFTIVANYGGDSLNTGSSASISQVVAAAMPACRVSYSVVSQSSTSFTTSISITNTGNSTFEPWALTFTWPGSQQVTGTVNSNFVQSGRSVRITGIEPNRAIAPGATLTGVGFNASYIGSNVQPAVFSVNGVRCQ